MKLQYVFIAVLEQRRNKESRFTVTAMFRIVRPTLVEIYTFLGTGEDFQS
jgi:hypothetical protein